MIAIRSDLGFSQNGIGPGTSIHSDILRLCAATSSFMALSGSSTELMADDDVQRAYLGGIMGVSNQQSFH